MASSKSHLPYQEAEGHDFMVPSVEETPPPYELMAPEGNSVVQDDGRIEVDLNSRACRAALKFVQWPSEEDVLLPPPEYTESVAPGIKLNIVIQVVGSRGDVQPFIALGNELQKYGHRVRLATHDVFDSFVRGSGLEFYPIGGDPAELMAYMVKNPGLIPKMKSLKAGDIQKKRLMVAEMLEGCWRSCIEDDSATQTPFVADAIIANPPSFAHVHCAQALGIPLHLMFTMPWSPTTAYPHPLANLKYSGNNSQFANSVSYGIVEWMTWQGLGDVINEWRATIDLEPVPTGEGPNLAQTLKVPFTYCWSPALLPKPADWPSYIDVCGFFFRDPPNYTPPPDLDAFLRQGPPPVYIGFGSIVIDDPPRMTQILEQTVRSLGVRAIISRGWSKLGGSSSHDIFYLGDCPHEWLFQHVSAVVHHGGAGTTACGLRFGKPTVIIPFFGDQPFWGNMIAASGAGPLPIHHRALTVEGLASAIQYCFEPRALKAAEDICMKMQAESGVKRAVESFHRNLPVDVMRCQILPDQPAVWAYKRSSMKPIRLSKLATQLLMDHLKIEQKNLQLFEARPIFIQNRRLDPLSSTTSAAIGTGTNMLKATTDMLLKPYQEVTRPSSSRSTSAHHVPTRSRSMQDLNGSQPMSAAPAPDTNEERTNWHRGGAAVTAGAKGFGKLLSSYSKGIIVDIPLAATEGLRAVPRLYGEEVEDYQVRDWKSGALAGGKNFAHNMREGFTGIWNQPRKGADEGALGVAKGIMKGTIGFTTMVPSAALGLVAYPAHGLCKSLHTAVKSKTRKQIVKSRHREGAYIMRSMGTQGLDRRSVMQTFDSLKREAQKAGP
ncbi:putative sterol glucosyltransferase [Aspergillus melleus]|uniref:putative sterol glucosyltransferase n=1 Tax=Aspergillus melleus TaxID=138277 RepID=UPI001E8E2BFC|nr:uncharacterized protein LDX57_001531 [Aspergillus melleus]KAH8423773.1 hypothetical protein LDX57_001531 [Aspergillus melleus]